LACWGQEDMSVLTKMVLGSSSFSGLMSAMATAQPSERRCLVSARPIPEEPPVMIAVGGAIVGRLRVGTCWWDCE
jgi:hypothetical protein